LKLRMARPKPLLIWGIFRPPKIKNRMARMMISSVIPKFNIVLSRISPERTVALSRETLLGSSPDLVPIEEYFDNPIITYSPGLGARRIVVI